MLVSRRKMATATRMLLVCPKGAIRGSVSRKGPEL